jgi:hypothetical protein
MKEASENGLRLSFEASFSILSAAPEPELVPDGREQVLVHSRVVPRRKHPVHQRRVLHYRCVQNFYLKPQIQRKIAQISINGQGRMSQDYIMQLLSC